MPVGGGPSADLFAAGDKSDQYQDSLGVRSSC